MVVGDIILAYFALFLVLMFRYRDYSLFPGPETRQFFFHFSIINLFWLLLLFAFDFYETAAARKTVILLKNLALFAILAMLFGALYFYLNPFSRIDPKTILFFDIIVFCGFIMLWRSAFGLMIRGAKFRRKIAVVGWQPELDELAPILLSSNCEIAAVFSASAFPGFETIKIFSNPNKFIEAIKQEKIDLIIVAAKPGAEESLVGGLLTDIALKIKTVSLEDFYEETAGKVPLRLIDEVWILDNISKSNRKNFRIAKRIFDIAVSLIGLAVTVVVSPFIVAAIKIDSPGPVFYAQKRKGKGGKEFLLYKFRTMTATPEQYLIPRAHDAGQITGAGMILKKTHLDEFPQFYNILKGDLSFVGPRPEWEKLAGEYEKEIPFYRYRYLVPPGFTGWAQINFPPSNSILEARGKFEYDIYYIKNGSFMFDVAIILKTIQLFFR